MSDKKREELYKFYLRLAQDIAQESKCLKYKVGAVLVNNGQIIGQGWNDTPPGYISCEQHFQTDESYDRTRHRAWSHRYEVHAEMYALMRAAQTNHGTKNSTMYCTLQPCWQCSKNLLAAGVTEFIFSSYHKSLSTNEQQEWQEFLQTCGVSFKQIDV